MAYRIDYPDEARRNLRDLPGHFRQRIRRLIEALADDPRPPQAQEMRENPNGYRIRLDPWRLIYRLDDETQTILIAAIRRKRRPETDEEIPWN